MDRILLGPGDRLIPWAEKVIGTRFAPDAQAIGWGNEETLRAVSVIDRFSDCDANIHIASSGIAWLRTGQLLYATFGYVFVQVGLRRVTGLVASKNVRALRFDQHLGFKIEGFCRHAAKDDDVFVLGMIREECRWIPPELRT